MHAIDGRKNIGGFMNTLLVGELYQAPAAIAAHGAFVAIGIVIFHFKIYIGLEVKQHKPVCPDAKAPVTEKIDLFAGEVGVFPFSIV
jgi:hypothetical protein